MQLTFNKQQLKKYAMLGLVAAAAATLGTEVIAGSGAAYGGNAFESVWNFLVEAMQGSLGKVAAGTMVLVGVIAGIARQSLMGFATGVGAGVGVYATPKVISTMVSATLEKAPVVTEMAIQVSNGL